MICEWCGQSFEGQPKRRFCGKSCVAKYGNSIQDNKIRRSAAMIKLWRDPAYIKSVSDGRLRALERGVWWSKRKVRACAYCAKEFTEHNSLYCSRACFRRSGIEKIINCKNCNCSFKRTAIAQKYCSDECKPRRKKLRHCLFCGEAFMPRKSTHLFCSYYCKNKNQNASTEARLKAIEGGMKGGMKVALMLKVLKALLTPEVKQQLKEKGIEL